MPTPVAHALAGAAIAWAAPRSAESVRSPFNLRLTTLCVGLAVAPDLDLLYDPVHRTFTHSLPFALLLTIVAILVTGQVTSIGDRRSGDVRFQNPATRWGYAIRIGLICGAAWSSHLLLDWLGTDIGPPAGIQLWWPFSREWFISGLDLFATVERRRPFSTLTIVKNLNALRREILLMAPVVLAAWWVARLRLRRATASLKSEV